jgi:hypothetical protein
MTRVTLAELPDGHSTRGLPLTLGGTYELLYRDGSNACITTDDPAIHAHVWRGRVRAVEAREASP